MRVKEENMKGYFQLVGLLVLIFVPIVAEAWVVFLVGSHTHFLVGVLLFLFITPLNVMAASKICNKYL